MAEAEGKIRHRQSDVRGATCIFPWNNPIKSMSKPHTQIGQRANMWALPTQVLLLFYVSCYRCYVKFIKRSPTGSNS